MTAADLDLANRLQAFAAYLERYSPSSRMSEIADIQLAAKRIRELTPPDLPEASRSSHHSG